MLEYRDGYIGLDCDVILEVTNDDGWTGADGWTWAMRIDVNRETGGTPVLTHDADSISISSNVLTLTWNITDTKTALLSEGKYEVDVTSNDGSGKILGWPELRGYMQFRRPLATA